MKDIRQPIISGFLKDREEKILRDIYEYRAKNRESIEDIILKHIDYHLIELYEGNRYSWLQEELLDIAQYILDNDLDNLVNEYIDDIDN